MITNKSSKKNKKRKEDSSKKEAGFFKSRILKLIRFIFPNKKDLFLIFSFTFSTFIIMLSYIQTYDRNFERIFLQSLIDNFFVINFTILGIIVTLIAISLSLTHEIKQNLSINYILKNNISYLFFTFILTSFLWSFFFVYVLNYKNQLYFLFLFTILFFLSFWYVWWFINYLSREKYYEHLFFLFKKELKRYLKNGDKNQFNSINKFIENINFNAVENKDLISEIKFLKLIFKYLIKQDTDKKQTIYLINEINKNIIKKCNNKYILIKIIELLNEIQYDLFYNKENNSKYYYIHKEINEIFKYVLYNKETKEFSKNFGVHSLLFIHNQISQVFEDEKDVENLKNIDSVINYSIETTFYIIMKILDIEFNNKNFKYNTLKKIIQDYIKLLEFFEDEPYNYNNKYYELTNNSEEKLFIDKKINIIKKGKDKIERNLLKIQFLILEKIENNKIEKDFFKLSFEIYNLKYKVFFEKYLFKDLFEFFDRDYFLKDEGANSYEEFNYNKYILILTYFNYFSRKEYLNLEKLNDNFFNEYNSKKLLTSLNLLRFLDALKFFESEKYEFKDFKKKIKKKIVKKVKKVKAKTINSIFESDLDNTRILKFKNDFEEHKNKNDIFKLILGNDYEPKLNELFDTKFGFNLIYNKEYFIKGTNWIQDLGRQQGFRFGFDKTLHILNEISLKIDKKNIINVKDFERDLKNIIESENEYILFKNVNTKVRNIAEFEQIHSLDKVKYEEGSIKYNNSKIRVFNIQTKNPILFKTGAFKLVQYMAEKTEDEELYFGKFETIKENDKVNLSYKIYESFNLENINEKFIWKFIK